MKSRAMTHRVLLQVFLLSTLWLTALTTSTASTSGTTYYVAPNGSDDNDGSLQNPWKTIQKAADAVQAGDTVYVRGGVYRDRVTLNSSGTPDARIIFRAYPGEQPIIDGSKPTGEWTHYSGEIYRASVDCNVHPVIIDDTLLDSAGSVSEMVEGTYFQSGNTLYVWCPGGGSPESRVVGIIKKFEGWEGYSEFPLFYIRGSYVILSGFIIRHSSGYGIFLDKSSDDSPNSHVRIENCEVKFIRHHGIILSEARDSEVIGCKVHHGCLSNWPRGAADWGMGISYLSGENGKIINNTVYLNNGEGIGTFGKRGGGYHGTNKIEIRNNVVYDNWSVNIWLDHPTGAVVDGNFVYSSGNQPQIYEQKSTPRGIACAEERDFGSPGDLRDGVITNNVVINCRSGFRFWYDSRAPAGAGLKNFLVANNTFVNNTKGDIDKDQISIDRGYHSGSVFRNNIIYQTDDRVLYVGGNYNGTDDTVFDHNVWYHPSNNNVFLWGGTTYDFAGWQAATGHGTESLWANPLFIDDTGFELANYKIEAESPCRDEGIELQNVTSDFWGTLRPQGSGYDIGAFEYGGTTPTQVQIFLPFVSKSSFP
jgi:hypothetical protein